MAWSRTAHDSIWTASLANLLLTVLPADEGSDPGQPELQQPTSRSLMKKTEQPTEPLVYITAVERRQPEY
jgi:hypothetical protein